MGKKEIWKDIDEHPGYQVSSCGRVRSFQKAGGRILGWIISDTPQRILKPAKSEKYPFVSLGRNSVHRIHRLVTRAFLGPCPKGLEVCHNDGDPENNHIENLRYDTRRANVDDAIEQGRYGSLTKSDVIAIRQRAYNGETYAAIAQDTALPYDCIRNACIGIAYKYHPGPIVTKDPERPLRGTRLTYSDAECIRERYKAGTPQPVLAKEYDVDRSYISYIVNNKRLVRPK